MASEVSTQYDEIDEVDDIEIDEIEDSPNGYVWTGTDALGRKSKLESYAVTAADAESDLRKIGVQVESLKPKNISGLFSKKGHLPKLQELASFARNFGEQIEAGNTPIQICKMLAEADPNETVADALRGVVNALHNGRELHEAFEIQRDAKGRPVFERELVSAIQIGVLVGASPNLDSKDGKKESGLLMTLRRYAEAKEKKDKIRSAIRSAMMYPFGVTVIAIAAIAVVTIWVMPVMEDMYKALLSGKADVLLPLPTRVMLAMSHFVWSFWGFVSIAVTVGLIMLFFKWWRSPAGQDFKGRNIIRLPGIGGFYRMLFASQLLRYLSMLSEGISDFGARFTLAAETTENPVYREMLENLAYLARTHGQEITPMFKPYLKLFGREFLGALMTADTAGNHAAPFYRFAQVMEIKVDRQLESVLGILKMVVILPIGLVVAGIVAAIILPFFELAGRMAQ